MRLLLVALVVVAVGVPMRLLWRDLAARHGRAKATRAMAWLVVLAALALVVACVGSWIFWSAFAWIASMQAAWIVVPFLVGWFMAYRVGRAAQRVAHAHAVWQGHPR